MNNIRLLFKKEDISCFTSHLDMTRAFSRAIFAKELPVWFTEGFHPHPHMVFGQPLPLGMAGEREFLDLKLISDIPDVELISKLNEQLPQGIEVVSVGEPYFKAKEIAFARFRTEIAASYADKFKEMWSQTEVIVTKKSKRGEKTVDLKQEAKELSFELKGDKLIIHSVLPCTTSGAITSVTLMDAFKQYIGEDVFSRHVREEFIHESGQSFR